MAEADEKTGDTEEKEEVEAGEEKKEAKRITNILGGLKDYGQKTAKGETKAAKATAAVGRGIKDSARDLGDAASRARWKAYEYKQGAGAAAGVVARKIAYSSANEIKLLIFLLVAAIVHFAVDIPLGFIVSPASSAFWLRVVVHMGVAFFAIFFIFDDPQKPAIENLREKAPTYFTVAGIAIGTVFIGNTVAWATSHFDMPQATLLFAWLSNSILVPVWIYYALLFQQDLESHIGNAARLGVVILWLALAFYLVSTTGVATAYLPEGTAAISPAQRVQAVDALQRGEQAVVGLPGNIYAFFTGMSQTIRKGIEKQIEYATGDYYTGKVDENKEEPLGVYIENLKASSTLFYQYETVFVWGVLKARTLDPEKEIRLEVECSADKDTDKEVRGDANPLEENNKFTTNVTTSEQIDLTCEIPANTLTEGYHQVTFSANFNFNTLSYYKTYFIDLERKRALEREGTDPLDQYGITDKNPVAVFTNGPIMIGMGTTTPLVGLSEDFNVRPRLGITIENRWKGKIKKITDFVIKVPPWTSLVACDHNIKESPCKDEEECEFGKYNHVYRLQKETTTEQGRTLVGMDKLVDFTVRNIACLVEINDINGLLGNAPIATKYFKVSVDYEYELQESLPVNIKKAAAIPAMPATQLPQYQAFDYSPEDYTPPAGVRTSLKSIIERYGDEVDSALQVALQFYPATGLSKELVIAMIYQESSGNPNRVSSAGAIGLMQVMPGTGSDVCGFSSSELNDPANNIECGTKYFAMLLNNYGGDVYKAIAAYNAGPDSVSRWEGNGQWQAWADAGYPCCTPPDCKVADSDSEIIMNLGTGPSGARYVCQTQNHVPRVLVHANMASEILAEEST